MPGVQLKSVQYAEHVGAPNAWRLDGLSLGPVNLIVGRNATGKTRTLNIIWNLARQFVPETRFRPVAAGYDVIFDDNGRKLEYILNIEDGKVTREDVLVDGENKLERDASGGRIYTATEKKKIQFRPPDGEPAAIARRDSLQHPFLEPLHEWASAVRHFMFGATLGKHLIVARVKEGPEADERDENQVVGIFRKAEKALGRPFVDAVLRDMAEMHYELEDVIVVAPENIKIVQPGVVTELLVIGVREKGVSGIVNQTEMSQGMFRALSILIQVNYSQMAKRANCILIDDIGEGLDFERSTQLIELLRRKAKASSFQLVMTTNDQFVMNHVPLTEWSVLQREGCAVRVRNHENSKRVFEDFRFVGMSNFAFFEMDFVNGPPIEEAATAHE